MTKSAILKIMGVSPTGKLLEHFLIARDFDYTINDLHDATKLSKITIKKVVQTMLEDDLIIKTRTIGKSQLYKLNKENKLIKKLTEFVNLVLDKQNEKIIKSKKEVS